MAYGASLINFDNFHDTEAIKNKALMNAANGGPNSGFEIDGMDFFKNPQLANEFPELKDDIDLIVSTESFVTRLVDFRHRVIANKGMSRGMAYELLELVPSLESHTSPMHFTQELSSIGCEMSLEAIDIKLWAIIAAAVAFVAALIYKFIDWLGFAGGGASSSGDAKADLDKVKEGIKESDKKLEKQEKAITETARIVREGKNEYVEVKIPDHQNLKAVEESDLPEPLKREIIRTSHDIGSSVRKDLEEREHYVKVKLSDILADLEGGAAIYDYLRRPNKWARIIYQDHSKALDLVTTAFEAFESGASIVLGNIEIMEDIIDDLEAIDAATDKMGKIAPGARISSKLDVMDMVLLNKGEFKVGGHAYPTMGHWAVAVKEAVNDPSEYRPFFTDLEDLLVSHEDAIRRLRKVRFVNILAFIDALQKAEPTLRKFDRIAKSEQGRERVGLDDPNSPRSLRAKALMRVATQMARNFNSLMTVYGIISKIYEEASKHGTMIIEKLRTNAKKIIAFYNKHGEYPPPTLVMMQEKLERQLEEQRQAEIQARMLPASAIVSIKDVGRVHVSAVDHEGNEYGGQDMSFEGAQEALRLLTDSNQKPTE